MLQHPTNKKRKFLLKGLECGLPWATWPASLTSTTPRPPAAPLLLPLRPGTRSGAGDSAAATCRCCHSRFKVEKNATRI